MTSWRRPLACLFVGVLACGDDAAVDAGVDAAVEDAAVETGVDATDGDADGGVALIGPDRVIAGEEACFELVGTDAPVRFAWGDESTDEGRGEVCHTWEFPGAFLVVARTDATDASKVVRVVLRPAAERPTRSTPILFTRHGGRAFVFSVTADDDSLTVIDADRLERIVRVEVCDSPRTLTRVGDAIAIACQGDALAFVEFDSWTVSALEMPRGSRPFGIVTNPGSEELLVTLQDTGEVARVRDRFLFRRIPVGQDVRAISVGSDDLALVSRWRADAEGATLYALDLGDESVLPVALPKQEGLDSDTDNSGVPSFLDTVVFTPDGFRALVPSLKANNVTGELRTGEPLRDETTARAILSEVVAFGPGDVEQSFRFSFDDLDYASALVATQFGERVYVSFMGAQRVLALDAYAFDIAGSIANVGHAPRGLALSDDDSRLFVYADLSREVRVYDVRDLRREPERLATIATVDVEPLAEIRGKQVFYASRDERMSRTSYLSCASCHLDGEGDNLVWDFTQRGEGLRNTPSLRGNVVGRLHWSGNFDEVQDFENDIRFYQGGGGFLSDDAFARTEAPLGEPKAGLDPDLDALADYVRSLRGGVGRSPFEANALGATLFESAGCATCHGGVDSSDSDTNVRHDVGTFGAGSGGRLGGALDGLDTPSLRGLWRTAPFLHDGSAPALREVIERSADEHGATSSLTDEEIDALVAHLRSLE